MALVNAGWAEGNTGDETGCEATATISGFGFSTAGAGSVGAGSALGDSSDSNPADGATGLVVATVSILTAGATGDWVAGIGGAGCGVVLAGRTTGTVERAESGGGSDVFTTTPRLASFALSIAACALAVFTS